MESIVEFALYTWVVVSILAILIQLVRIARHRRAKKHTLSAESTATSSLATETIDLEARSAKTGSNGQVEAAARVSVSASATGPGATASSTMPAPPPAPKTGATPTPSTPTPSAPTPSAPTASAPAAQPLPPQPPPSQPLTPEPAIAEPSTQPVEPVSINTETVADGPIATPSVADVQPPVVGPADDQDTPALADLLAGVRLPWNLLPTVDKSRDPSNERVVLITSEGEPSEIGADVADELERLGFSISTRGEDTALAERGGHRLGLQIIPEPLAARVNDSPRFPSATPGSVALDIWIDA